MANRRNILDCREGLCTLFLVRHVRIEQGQVKLNVKRLFIKLSRQVHARFGSIDMFVQVEDEVV